MSDRDKALKILLDQINGVKRGQPKPAIPKIGFLSDIAVLDVPALSSGSLALDMALGIGGYAKGRIIEVFGAESSGKSTLCQHAVASCQAEGGLAAYIDMEHSLDLTYAKNLGVVAEDLLISQPDTGDEALEIADQLARSGLVDLVVVDSVAALLPREELEKGITDASVALIARAMSQGLRRLSPACSKNGTTLMFINQIREKPMVLYGSPLTTPGGRALKFYSAQRISLQGIKPIKENGQLVGNEVTAKVVKNKVGPPFREATFNIMYGTGIDKFADMIATAANVGILEKAGAWVKYEGETIGQGINGASAYFQENPDKLDEVREKTLATVGVKPVKKEEEPVVEEEPEETGPKEQEGEDDGKSV